MKKPMKRVSDLTAIDFSEHPVWILGATDACHELSARPAQRLPVKSLQGKLVGVLVVLANGQKKWAMLGNIHESDPQLTEHFLTVAVEHHGQWISLPRYFDPDYVERGPEAFASAIGMKLPDVFPMSYDVRSFAKGVAESLAREIPAVPPLKLSIDELAELAVP